MILNRQNFKGIFACFIMLSSTIGLGLDFIFAENLSTFIRLFSYFTIQSNFFIIISMALVLYYNHKKIELPNSYRIFLLCSGFWIMLTGLAYHFMLSGTTSPQGVFYIANICLHYITPFAMVLFLLVFESKKDRDLMIPIYSMAYPLVYCIGSMIRGAIDGYYPYWFFNPSGSYPQGNESMFNVVIYICILSISFVLIGYSFILLRKIYSTSKKVLSHR